MTCRKKFCFCLFLFGGLLSGDEFFTVSICTTSTLDHAQSCQTNYLKNTTEQSFIIQEAEDRFRTVCGKFATKEEAIKFKTTLDTLALSQGAFIKAITQENKGSKPENKQTEEKVIAKKPIKIEQIFDTPKQIVLTQKHIPSKFNEREIKSFEEMIIDVDSKTNTLYLKAVIDGNIIKLDEYKVSTARVNAKKPLGEGKITQISINPSWYPTQKTIDYFKTKGITLPREVPPGHPYNYMGGAKINLTHQVDGQTIYRIHGTLNEKTIGSYESSGCIRMKNNDVKEVASLLSRFSKIKNRDKIKVFLR